MGGIFGYNTDEFCNYFIGKKQTEEEMERTLEICELLKDADALDRERFFEREASLNSENLHSKTAKDIRMQQFAFDLNNLFAKKIVTRILNGKVIEPEGSYIEELYKMRREGMYDKIETLSLEEVYEVLSELGLNKKYTLNEAYSTYELGEEEIRQAATIRISIWK